MCVFEYTTYSSVHFVPSVAGMRVLHWCMLGLTILLLVCEVTLSQLCKSLIILVDAFYTLFILMRMALPPPQPASIIKPPPSLVDSPVSPPHASSSSAAPPCNLPAESSIEHLPVTQTATGGSTVPDQSHRDAASLVNSPQLLSVLQLSTAVCPTPTAGFRLWGLSFLLSSWPLCVSLTQWKSSAFPWSHTQYGTPYCSWLSALSVCSIRCWCSGWTGISCGMRGLGPSGNTKVTLYLRSWCTNIQQNNMWYHFLIRHLYKGFINSLMNILYLICLICTKTTTCQLLPIFFQSWCFLVSVKACTYTGIM